MYKWKMGGKDSKLSYITQDEALRRGLCQCSCCFYEEFQYNISEESISLKILFTSSIAP